MEGARIKVLIADLFSAAAKAELEKEFDVKYDDKLNGETLKSALSEFKPEILVVRGTKVTGEMMETDPHLAYVVRAGQGFDTIEFNWAAQHGIYVANCPGKNAIAVAELVMGLMLCVDRKIPENIGAMKEGKWQKGKFTASVGMKGKSLGLLGLGNIGKEVATRALAFGMKVYAWDKFVPEWAMEAVGVEKIETYFELAALCDVISVHLPKIPKTDFDPGTVDIINEEFLSKMKCDGTLINTSRGDLVDDDALIAKLDACPKFYAAVDVYRGEPQVKECEFVHPFGKHDRVYTTHHIGASTKQSEAAIGEEALRIVKKFGATKVPSNVINYGKFVKKA